MGSPTISQAKILEAAGGNAALLELLTQISQTTAQQQSATGTTPVSGPASTQQATAPVPAQATGYVSLVGTVYSIQLVNPGGVSPISQIQAAAQGKTVQQPTTTIFHQLRASTSPAFNVNSNTQTFGGNTGSTQTLWTLNNLGSGTWYFQFRSSYDGVNWNTWKNANNGSALGGIVGQVSTVSAAYTEWALSTLSGKLIFGIFEGQVPDTGVIGVPSGYSLYTSGMLAIAGPNGYGAAADATYGITTGDIILESGSGGSAGIPDFPAQVFMKWGYSGYQTSGTATVFGVAFDPTSPNVKLYAEGGAHGALWARFTLPGGARIAIGQGRNFDGDTIWTPSELTWISGSRMLSICAPTDVNDGPPGPGVLEGVNVCQLSGLSLEAKYQSDTGGTGAGTYANWLAIAWEQGAPTVVAGGATYLKIPLRGGHAMYIGGGQVASGTAITLPAGCNSSDMLSICTPGSTTHTGNHLRGVQQCSFLGLEPTLAYSDNSNTWSGNVNWMVAAWK